MPEDIDIPMDDSEVERDGEAFLLKVSSKSTFDDDARARLQPIIQLVCTRLDTELVRYNAGEQTVTLALKHSTSTPLYQLISKIKKNVQVRYASALDEDKRRGDAPKEAVPVMWSGQMYLGPDRVDYRTDGTPAVPSNEELQQTPFHELRRLAMVHGLFVNQQRLALLEELQDVRETPQPSFCERMENALKERIDRTDFSLKVRTLS